MASSNSTPDSEATMTIDFFSKVDGSDQFTMVLLVSDFERYSEIAENLEMPIEDFMVQIAEAQLHEHNTQWTIPGVDEDGNISLKDAVPVEIPSVEQLSKRKDG